MLAMGSSPDGYKSKGIRKCSLWHAVLAYANVYDFLTSPSKHLHPFSAVFPADNQFFCACVAAIVLVFKAAEGS